MDGTLVDSEKIWEVALGELAEHLGGNLGRPARQAMVGSNMATSMTVLFADLGLEPRRAALADAGQWLAERTRELFRRGLPWRPGARQALAAVRSAGWPAALVTNTERRLVEVALDAIGRHWFDAVVCGDEVSHGKPEPDAYLRAAELLGVSAADCLAVEDSPTGTAAAEAAGCAVLVVPSEVDVPDGPRRVSRPSLDLVTIDELGVIFRDLQYAARPAAAG
jgi:HAD superfamily hydrolase (TIGR01509 family)